MRGDTNSLTTIAATNLIADVTSDTATLALTQLVSDIACGTWNTRRANALNPASATSANVSHCYS
jgi:hypothetical protein